MAILVQCKAILMLLPGLATNSQFIWRNVVRSSRRSQGRNNNAFWSSSSSCTSLCHHITSLFFLLLFSLCNKLLLVFSPKSTLISRTTRRSVQAELDSLLSHADLQVPESCPGACLLLVDATVCMCTVET